MKIKDLGDSIVFDTFPLKYEPKQKIILTHLLHLEEQIFPAQLPMIFTTQKLADTLRNYCELKKYKCISKDSLVVVKPYEFIDVVIERRITLQILFCASEEEELNNIMVLIRQNGELNYIYGGNFIDIRSALLNDTFASWISHGVNKLYVNLKRIEENHIFNEVDQMQKVFHQIKTIMSCFRKSKINIHLPLFGFEHFILKLAQHFPKRIKYTNLNQFYLRLVDDDPIAILLFLDANSTDEKIILHTAETSPLLAKRKFEKFKEISIKICHDSSNCNDYTLCNNNGYYELFFSPEPSPFNLKLLCMLVKPKRIFGIVDTFNNKSIVPKYLYEHCVGAKKRMQKKIKLSDPLSSSKYETPKNHVIIVGGAISKKSGPFLSDSESDEYDDDE